VIWHFERGRVSAPWFVHGALTRPRSKCQAFINALFKDVLGRKATAAEILMLSAKVNGMGRARFAAEFIAANQAPLGAPAVPPVIILP
jgi:hypothetical protein